MTIIAPNILVCFVGIIAISLEVSVLAHLRVGDMVEETMLALRVYSRSTSRTSNTIYCICHWSLLGEVSASPVGTV